MGLLNFLNNVGASAERMAGQVAKDASARVESAATRLGIRSEAEKERAKDAVFEDALQTLHDASPARGGMDLMILDDLVGDGYEETIEIAEDHAAYLMSAYSTLSYMPFDELEPRMEALGYEIVTIEQNGIEVYVAMETQTGAIFTAFRGTDSSQDMMRNASLEMSPIEGTDLDITVQDAYYQAMTSGQPSVLEQVESAVADFQSRFEHEQPVLLTGHSAGATCASIFALYQAHKEDPTPVTMTALYNPAPIGDRPIEELLDGRVRVTLSENDMFNNFMEEVYQRTGFARPVGDDLTTRMATRGETIVDDHGPAAILAAGADEASARRITYSVTLHEADQGAMIRAANYENPIENKVAEAAMGALQAGVVMADENATTLAHYQAPTELEHATIRSA